MSHLVSQILTPVRVDAVLLSFSPCSTRQDTALWDGGHSADVFSAREGARRRRSTANHH